MQFRVYHSATLVAQFSLSQGTGINGCVIGRSRGEAWPLCDSSCGDFITSREMAARFWQVSASAAYSRSLKKPRKPVRAGANLSNGFKLIWAVQPCVEKYFCFHPTQITGLFVAIPPRQRGVS
jgi:hypothetical protein